MENNGANKDGGKNTEGNSVSGEDSCTITEKANLDMKQGQMDEEYVPM